MTSPKNDQSLAGDAVRIAAADATNPASLDKVRDILFGNQMRDVERRFARLEERLAKETADLKEDLRKRLDTLEAYMRRESESLEGQIKAERADRVDAHASLANELKDNARAFERRSTSIDEQHSKGQRDLRQQMLEQHQRLSDDLRQKVEEILATLSRTAQELRTDKTDRATLAALLTEVAMRLTDDFRLPGAEDVGNG
jgi:DNA repair exonuclease SbcCD ATPase subunit